MVSDAAINIERNARDGRAAGLWFVVACPAGKGAISPWPRTKHGWKRPHLREPPHVDCYQIHASRSAARFPSLSWFSLAGWGRACPPGLTTLGGEGVSRAYSPSRDPIKRREGGAGPRAIATRRAKSHQQILDFQKTIRTTIFFPRKIVHSVMTASMASSLAERPNPSKQPRAPIAHHRYDLISSKEAKEKIA
jgi:hypothetical protein